MFLPLSVTFPPKETGKCSTYTKQCQGYWAVTQKLPSHFEQMPHKTLPPETFVPELQTKGEGCQYNSKHDSRSKVRIRENEATLNQNYILPSQKDRYLIQYLNLFVWLCWVDFISNSYSFLNSRGFVCLFWLKADSTGNSSQERVWSPWVLF